MPNGDVPGGTGLLGPVISGITSFVGSIFGGGGDGGEPPIQSEEFAVALDRRSRGRAPRDAREAFVFSQIQPEQIALAQRQLDAARSPITGRLPIPTPAEGGPPLVTGREPLPVLQELGIPFLEPLIPGFQQRPLPELDVLEVPMALDATLLSGFSGVPARVVAPTVSGFLGGIAQDIVSGFLRAPQEMGMAQVPQRLPSIRAPQNGERPSTRILRRIFENTGVRIKLSAAKALTRQLGLEAAANCLRVSVMDLCTLIITPSPRRRSGISGSDIRIVKRTARRFQSLQEDLSGLVSRRRAAPRRKPRHVHALAHTAPGG